MSTCSWLCCQEKTPKESVLTPAGSPLSVETWISNRASLLASRWLKCVAISFSQLDCGSWLCVFWLSKASGAWRQVYICWKYAVVVLSMLHKRKLVGVLHLSVFRCGCMCVCVFVCAYTDFSICCVCCWAAGFGLSLRIAVTVAEKPLYLSLLS